MTYEGNQKESIFKLAQGFGGSRCGVGGVSSDVFGQEYGHGVGVIISAAAV
jgi:hypothetical protein